MYLSPWKSSVDLASIIFYKQYIRLNVEFSRCNPPDLICYNKLQFHNLGVVLSI